jgi:hypothetical protein
LAPLATPPANVEELISQDATADASSFYSYPNDGGPSSRPNSRMMET